MRPDITLYFVRHGETDWNAVGRYQGQSDIPLNDKGRGQAAGNGSTLRAYLPDPAALDFVASPLSRTRETMELLRRAIGLPADGYRTDGRLMEVHYGRWEGQLWTDLPTIDPDGVAARKRDTWNWRPVDGESYADVAIRLGAWLEEVTTDTVVVAHGGVSRILRQRVLGIDPRDVPSLEVPQDRVLVLRAGQAHWLA
ncbi:MAG: histidine phosphatase family protein [Hyphomicrobiaceae bacterium]